MNDEALADEAAKQQSEPGEPLTDDEVAGLMAEEVPPRPAVPDDPYDDWILG